MKEAEDKKQVKRRPPKCLRWDDADWERVKEAAESMGMTRGALIRFATRSAIEAAERKGIQSFLGSVKTDTENLCSVFFGAPKKFFPAGKKGTEAHSSRSEEAKRVGTTHEISAQPRSGVSRKLK